MSKRGKEYERVVAAIAQAFDQRAKVETGKWVTGPDGRRELDVLISSWSEDPNLRILIECKDFNPRTTGPVGIGYVDALDSKRNDVGASNAFLCCNAGFTREAVRKAIRVGIGLIAVMKKGDSRLRHRLIDEAFYRKVRITGSTMHFDPTEGLLPDLPPLGLLFEGSPVANWVHHRAALIVAHNPVVAGTLQQSISFAKPLLFTWECGQATFTKIGISFTIEGSWYSHETEIDSDAGIYNWTRRRVLLAPVNNSLIYKNVDFDKGTPILTEPDSSMFRRALQRGETHLELLIIDGMHSSSPLPGIDAHVVPEDRDVVIPGIHGAESPFAHAAASSDA